MEKFFREHQRIVFFSFWETDNWTLWSQQRSKLRVSQAMDFFSNRFNTVLGFEQNILAGILAGMRGTNILKIEADVEIWFKNANLSKREYDFLCWMGY